MGAKQRWANGLGYRGQVFYRAIEKYGWDNIKHEILFENISKEDAVKKEIELINLYKSNCYKWNNPTYGYNATDGGDLRESGFNLTEETKAKISNSNYHNSKKRKIDCFDLDGRFTKTYDDIASVSSDLGIERTNIVKCCRKKSEYIGGKIFRYNDETNGEDIDPYIRVLPSNAKVVSKYTMNGKFIKTYSSISEAARENNCIPENIASCAKGKYNSSNGFIWLFGTQDEIECLEPRIDKTKEKKSICAYDLDGNLCKIFDSIIDAKRWIGKPNGANINAVLAGRRNKAYGYVWRYVN